MRASYAYDAAGQVVDIVHDKAGEVLASFKYAYDGAGNRVSKEMADGVKEAYGYDGDGRLTSVAYGTARRVDYTLDAVGNRTVMEEAMGATLKSTRYTYNAFNQLLSLNVAGSCGTGCPGAINTAFAYDGNGNLLSETTTVVGQAGSAVKRYAWDLDNRLRQVQMPDGAAHEYAYDANDLRIEQVTPVEATRYVLDGPSVVEEMDAASATRTSYLPNPQVIDEILSFEQAGKAYYPLTDALASIYAIADSVGAVVRSNSYDVYGERTTNGTGPNIAWGFTGREHDPTDLNYHRDRHVAPAVGRWNQPDRFGFIDGPNRYWYARGSPTGLSDPLGRAGWNPLTRVIAKIASDDTLYAAALYVEAALQQEDAGVSAAMFAEAAFLMAAHLVAKAVAGTDVETCAVQAEKRALKLGLNIESRTTAELLENWNMPIRQFISKCRATKILRKFPAQWLDKPLGQALADGGSTVVKLLTDGRFVK